MNNSMQRATGDTLAIRPIPPDETNTAIRGTAADVTSGLGFLKDSVRILSKDLNATHRHALIDEWGRRTLQRSKKNVQHLLEELADDGFSWNDIARIAGVTVPAVRKWRRTGSATPDNRKKLAALLAACDILRERFVVEDVASWFEIPCGGTPVTPMDLYCHDRADLVFELAGATSNPNDVLDEYDPQWREHYGSPFEVVTGEDGIRSVQPKG